MKMIACWSTPSPKDAYTLAVFSVMVTIVGALGGIILYQVTGSSLCLAYGLENLVDLFSSIIVLWRFFVPTKLTARIEKQLNAREHHASIAISFVLVLLGLGLSAASLHDFATNGKSETAATSHDKRMLIVSYVSVIIFGILTIVKFRYSFALNSPSLYKDGICSLIGTVTATALFLNTLIISRNHNLWWFDPSVALFSGLCALLYGVYTIYIAYFIEGKPLFSLQYWRMIGIEEEEVDQQIDKTTINNVDQGTDDDNDVESSIRRNEEGTMA